MARKLHENLNGFAASTSSSTCTTSSTCKTVGCFETEIFDLKESSSFWGFYHYPWDPITLSDDDWGV